MANQAENTWRRRLRLPAFALCILLIVVAAFFALYSAELPAPTGPFPVGRMQFVWTDPSRFELWSDDPAEFRCLLVHVWYPAQRAPGDTLAPYFPDLRALRGGFHWYERFAIHAVHSHALADAAPAAAVPLPVLVFSPGANNSSLFYASLLEELASYGYLVVGMEHTYEGRGQAFPDGRITSALAERHRPSAGSPTREADDARFYRQRVEVRARDASFVIDQLARANREGVLGGRLDLTRVGVFGHSLGGVAAAYAAMSDDRFAAAANLDGLTYGQPLYANPVGEAITQPFLYLGKPLRTLSSDELRRDGITQSQLEKARAKQRAKQDHLLGSVRGGSYRVSIPGAIHASFSDEPFWEPGGADTKRRVATIVRKCTRAFFDKELLGSEDELSRDLPPHLPEIVVDRFLPKRKRGRS
jgi:dienelactone hydrolase